MSCKRIRKLIDEADRPGNIPFEAARHTQICESCSRFVDERIRLAELLDSTGRVTAPPDFNVVLRRRLRERSSARRAYWSIPAFIFKLAGAFAVLVCSMLLAQWMRHGARPAAPGNQATAEVSPLVPGGTTTSNGLSTNTSSLPAVAAPGNAMPVRFVPSRPRFNRSVRDQVAEVLPPDGELHFPSDPRKDAAAFLLVKSQTAEQGMYVPSIILGAQPLLSKLNPGTAADAGGRVSF
jgi:hypothetical protein